MKILSWNVNGIRAVLQKGCFAAIQKENADILCLQEVKAHPDQVKIDLPSYYQYWNAAEKPGYSGTAIFTKIKPISVQYGLDTQPHKGEGRIITLEFKDYYFITVYTPNSGRGLPRLSYRKKWDDGFLKYVKKLESKKPVIFCGDLNVAHQPIDLANPKNNYNKTAGYTQVEIDGFQQYIDAGFIDTFREFNKKPGQYTYWGVWNNLRARNIGWRIDYFITSKSLRSRLKDAFILPKIMGSDHCPVGILLK